MAPARARTTPRRGTEHVRQLALEAARELFATKGYDGTTTKEISLRSGVSEPVLFGNFGNKAGLFNAAVAEPFIGAIERYEESWRRLDETVESRVDRFVRDLYDLARDNKVLLLSALLRRSVWQQRRRGRRAARPYRHGLARHAEGRSAQGSRPRV